MLKQQVSSSLLPDASTKCIIHNRLNVTESINAQQLKLNKDVSVINSVQYEKLTVGKNANIGGNLEVLGATVINEGLSMVNRSVINMNGRKIVNMPTLSFKTALNSDACNYGMLTRTFPIFYCKTSTHNQIAGLDEKANLPWNVLARQYYRSQQFNNYFRIDNNGQDFRILQPGVYQFGVSITKKRGWNNGYGQFISIDWVNTGILSRTQIWNKGATSLPICLNAAVQITSSNLSGALFRITHTEGGGRIELSLFSYSVLGFLEL